MTPTYRSRDEEIDAWTADQLADAECAEQWAAECSFYPEKQITAEMLLAYAAECRALVATRESARASLRAAVGPDPRLADDGYWR